MKSCGSVPTIPRSHGARQNSAAILPAEKHPLNLTRFAPAEGIAGSFRRLALAGGQYLPLLHALRTSLVPFLRSVPSRASQGGTMTTFASKSTTPNAAELKSVAMKQRIAEPGTHRTHCRAGIHTIHRLTPIDPSRDWSIDATQSRPTSKFRIPLHLRHKPRLTARRDHLPTPSPSPPATLLVFRPSPDTQGMPAPSTRTFAWDFLPRG